MTHETLIYRLRGIPRDSRHHDVLAFAASLLNAVSYLEIGVQEGASLRRVLSFNRSISRIGVCNTWGKEHGGTGRGNHNHII